jgi:hypothetical protein
VYVPCSLTSAESARSSVADVVFRLPDGVDLDDFFTRLNHTARTLAVYASPWGRPFRRKTRFRLYLRPWPDGVGYPRGFSLKFQLIASSSAGGSVLAHQEGGKAFL